MNPGGKSFTVACWYCGHPDGRDATHARGCPRLTPVSQERMFAIAAACERGWREVAAERGEKRAAKVERTARRETPAAQGPRLASSWVV
jgi:hypothetical protein